MHVKFICENKFILIALPLIICNTCDKTTVYLVQRACIYTNTPLSYVWSTQILLDITLCGSYTSAKSNHQHTMWRTRVAYNDLPLECLPKFTGKNILWDNGSFFCQERSKIYTPMTTDTKRRVNICRMCRVGIAQDKQNECSFCSQGC